MLTGALILGSNNAVRFPSKFAVECLTMVVKILYKVLGTVFFFSMVTEDPSVPWLRSYTP